MAQLVTRDRLDPQVEDATRTLGTRTEAAKATLEELLKHPGLFVSLLVALAQETLLPLFDTFKDLPNGFLLPLYDFGGLLLNLHFGLLDLLSGQLDARYLVDHLIALLVLVF